MRAWAFAVALVLLIGAGASTLASTVPVACPSTIGYITSGGTGTATLMSAPSAFNILKANDPTGSGVAPAYWLAWNAGNYAAMPAVWSLTTPESAIVGGPFTSFSPPFTFLSPSQPYANFNGGGYDSNGGCEYQGVVNNTLTITTTATSTVTSTSSTTVSSTTTAISTTAVTTTFTVTTTIAGSLTTITTTAVSVSTVTMTMTAPQGGDVPPASNAPSFNVFTGITLLGAVVFAGVGFTGKGKK